MGELGNAVQQPNDYKQLHYHNSASFKVLHSVRPFAFLFRVIIELLQRHELPYCVVFKPYVQLLLQLS